MQGVIVETLARTSPWLKTRRPKFTVRWCIANDSLGKGHQGRKSRHHWYGEGSVDPESSEAEVKCSAFPQTQMKSSAFPSMRMKMPTQRNRQRPRNRVRLAEEGFVNHLFRSQFRAYLAVGLTSGNKPPACQLTVVPCWSCIGLHTP